MAKQNKTTEGLVADAVLQKPLGTLTIDGVKYTIDRPRMITHVLVSEMISRLPGVSICDNIEDQITEVLRVAKDCRVLGDIAALLVLGGKRLTEERTVEKKHLFGLIRTKSVVVVNLQKELADKLLAELSPMDFKGLIVDSFRNLQLPVFFAVITSLYEANLLKPTSEVQTTVSGL